jgi:hypothetical protein
MTSVSIQLGAALEEGAPVASPDRDRDRDRTARLRARALQAACTHGELIDRSAAGLAAQAAALCVIVDRAAPALGDDEALRLPSPSR